MHSLISSRILYYAAAFAAAYISITMSVCAQTNDLLIVNGDIANERNGMTVNSQSALFSLNNKGIASYSLSAEMQLARSGGTILIQVGASDSKPSAQVEIQRDAAGSLLRVVPADYIIETGEWSKRSAINYYYWPTVKESIDYALESGLPQQTWYGRWIPVRVDVNIRHLSIWIEGRLVEQVALKKNSVSPVTLELSKGDRLRTISLAPFNDDGKYLTIDMRSYVNTNAYEAAVTKVDSVPFSFSPDRNGLLDLIKTQWPDVTRDPSDYYENYDGDPYFLSDPRTPRLRVPVEDYIAAHVLAVADGSPQHTSILTLRAGHYGYFNDQVIEYHFKAQVPSLSGANSQDRQASLKTAAGSLFHVRIPMTEAFTQDICSPYMDIELTKDIRLAVRRPDPCRFRYRPLGLSSGVKIAAITLERSPLQMRVSSNEPGHVFVMPRKPVFKVKLENITAGKYEYSLQLQYTHYHGFQASVNRRGSIAPLHTVELSIELPVKTSGYHDLVVTLKNGKGDVLLQRHTSFALLPVDTRRFRDRSPFGTGDFGGSHFTPDKADLVGPLYVKAGLRYGTCNTYIKELAKYGVINSFSLCLAWDPSSYKKFYDCAPDHPVDGLIFHEDAISARHEVRLPDFFTDYGPYKMDDIEEKRFQKMWDAAINAGKYMRENYPNTRLLLGNGGLTVKEELYKHKFPAYLFDAAGNEPPSFGRIPETQPPDAVSGNASIWMDRQLLDAYGYKDKIVSQCHETTFPLTSPGNLDARNQADYLIRHAMHSLAWGMTKVYLSGLTDVGDSYYSSNWGAEGMVRVRPEMDVKPAYVAIATMTRVLDGAKFVRDVPTGSASVYCLEFALPDAKSAYVIWTIRGARPVSLKMEKPGAWKLINDQSEESILNAARNAVCVTATQSPVYVVGQGELASVTLGEPAYVDKPTGKTALLSSLGDMNEWVVDNARNSELETYNPMTPRRKGDFTYQSVSSFEGRYRVIKVIPKPISNGKETMPMYSVLVHSKGVPVPGTPTEVGLWVNGNSRWGRIMFEFTDAIGQRWTSIGCRQSDDVSTWMLDWMPKDMIERYKNNDIADWNTEDEFGKSRINFDGWRYLAFPMPGQYPGEQYHWPGNCNWRYDKDGIVHYPLVFRKLIVELPTKTLHVKDYAPVGRPEIYIKDLVVSQGDTAMLKNTAGDYDWPTDKRY